jgi:hypothetical protein
MSLSISGLVPNLPDPIGSRPDRLRETPQGPFDSLSQAGSLRPEGPAAGEVTVDGVERVDPKLWTLLSGEERAFYLRSSMTGPATYGPADSSEHAAASGRRLGGRLDMRI